jgi:hypothetical protein
VSAAKTATDHNTAAAPMSVTGSHDTCLDMTGMIFPFRQRHSFIFI